MFASARSVNGSPRAFPVTDHTLKRDIIELVRGRDKRGAPTKFLPTRTVAPSSLLAINVAGRQGHILLTTHGGRAIAFLVYASSGDVDVVPLRFSASRHDPATLARCTFAQKDGLLVLDDLCDERPIAERLSDLHDLVHSDHTPDPFLFPLRVVARRFYAVTQAAEAKRLIRSDAFNTHSVSVIDTDGSVPPRHVERRIFADARETHGPRVRRVEIPNHQTTTAIITRAAEPESYRVSVDGGREWSYLCVKTIEESAHLTRVFLTHPDDPVSGVVESDGGKWRFLGVCAAPAAPIC